MNVANSDLAKEESTPDRLEPGWETPSFRRRFSLLVCLVLIIRALSVLRIVH